MVGDGGAWESAGAWRYRLYVRGELPFLLPARAAAGGASRQSRLLGRPAAERAARCARKGGVGWISTTALRKPPSVPRPVPGSLLKIGRASGRERVCQYV